MWAVFMYLRQLNVGCLPANAFTLLAQANHYGDESAFLYAARVTRKETGLD